MNLEKVFYYIFSLYIIVYIGYSFYINLLHISYSIISLLAILLPLIILFIIQWILWKYTDVRNKKKVKTRFITISILSFIPVIYCVVILGVNEYKSNFTTERWLNNPGERVYLIDDLLNEYKLIDKTKTEVHTLLGSPTETEYFKDENNIVYHLGNERGLISIDSEWLIIWFNDNEKVTKYEIVTD